MQICFLTPGVDLREKNYNAHQQFGDRQGRVTSARTYFYADEAKCDQHMETFMKCIKASGTDGLQKIGSLHCENTTWSIYFIQ